MEQIAAAETLTRSQYEQFVDKAIDEFTRKKYIAESEAEKLRTKLKGRWEDIAEHVDKGLETIGKQGADTMKSAVTQALNGAAEELSDHKDNKNIDQAELLKRASVSGAESALEELTTSIGEANNTEIDTKNK